MIKMSKDLLFIFLLVVSVIDIKAQSIIKANGDTLLTITPSQDIMHVLHNRQLGYISGDSLFTPDDFKLGYVSDTSFIIDGIQYGYIQNNQRIYDVEGYLLGSLESNYEIRDFNSKVLGFYPAGVDKKILAAIYFIYFKDEL